MNDIVWEKVSSKICHDLASPIGAIGLVKDLVLDDPHAVEDVLKHTYEKLERYIRLYRFLFGYKKYLSSPTFADLSEIVDFLYKNKIDVSFLGAIEDDGPVNRILLSLLYFLSTSGLNVSSVVISTNNGPTLTWVGEPLSLQQKELLNLGEIDFEQMSSHDIYLLWAAVFAKRYAKKVTFDPLIQKHHLIIRSL